MRIAVLVKQVPDTWGERQLDPATGRVHRAQGDSVFDEVGERALETALRYQDSHDAEVVVLSMGPGSVPDVLRKALAMGAASAIHVLDEALAGADLARTAEVLSAALRTVDVDLVVAGNESTDGRGGVVPAMIAEHLGVPHLTFLNSVEISPGKVFGERGTDDGALDARSPLPAVISVTERAPEGRFPSFMGIRKAKKKPVTVFTLADLGLADPDQASPARSVVVSTAERPPRSAGTKIVDDGTAADQLADYLAHARLI